MVGSSRKGRGDGLVTRHLQTRVSSGHKEPGKSLFSSRSGNVTKSHGKIAVNKATKKSWKFCYHQTLWHFRSPKEKAKENSPVASALVSLIKFQSSASVKYCFVCWLSNCNLLMLLLLKNSKKMTVYSTKMELFSHEHDELLDILQA